MKSDFKVSSLTSALRRRGGNVLSDLVVIALLLLICFLLSSMHVGKDVRRARGKSVKKEALDEFVNIRLDHRRQLTTDEPLAADEEFPEAPIRVHAVGLKEVNWYFAALTGSFDKCYDQGYLDRSLRCEYIQESEHFTAADVVVFRATYLDQSPLAKAVLEDPNRPPNQWWVFFDNEPPYKVWKYSNLANYKGVFNLTATYSLSSDVPRFDMRRLKHCVRSQKRYNTLKGIDYTKKKRNGTAVAWLASECNTQSKRENYVKELQKHIDVDVYGECGPLKCGSRSLNTWSKDRCHDKLLHQKGSYKFYLSFENSLCKDYVTEKLWMLMKMDIVPVVMGLVDYSNMLPKDSYIDVRDFPSPAALANYLKFLDENPAMYNEYIRNKNSLICYLKYPYMPWECTLCERMHELRGTRGIVYDVGKFWGSSQCLSPKQFFAKPVADDEFDV
ncbi:hypothetical protein CAPTEDRAFT_228957 [Capitella teleta]|uniref:Fucosyltransferase n=1 Tax=Capitella teleta TaxID=283909 RepID=R7UM28_CAPTE|nr:hypothetical protein CAPTEDRAFT_228957 [Capitella teleta]|eukprot:ELU07138.1 hypothetical protein CAPTEDRAFT_228957 [Capitella teleta]